MGFQTSIFQQSYIKNSERPSPYLFASPQYSVTWETSLNYRERPYNFLPQHNCQFHCGIDYPQLSPTIQTIFKYHSYNILDWLMVILSLISKTSLQIWATRTLTLSYEEVTFPQLQISLVVFPAFLLWAPPLTDIWIQTLAESAYYGNNKTLPFDCKTFKRLPVFGWGHLTSSADWLPTSAKPKLKVSHEPLSDFSDRSTWPDGIPHTHVSQNFWYNFVKELHIRFHVIPVPNLQSTRSHYFLAYD